MLIRGRTADLDIKREIARIALKQYLAGLEGVQLQDVVIRLIKKKPPSWDEVRPASSSQCRLRDA